MPFDKTKFIANQVAKKDNIENIISLKKKIIEDYIEQNDLMECVKGLCNHTQTNKINFEITKNNNNIEIENTKVEFEVCLNGILIKTMILDIKYFDNMIKDIDETVNLLVN